MDKLPFAYARIEKGSKFSQVCLAADEKLYLPDFWRNGVCLAHARTDDILDLAKVIDFWLNHDISTGELAEKFGFVQPNENAKAFDENKEVEYTWNLILQDESRADLRDFIRLAIRDEVLNKLFPFTSLHTLCFSRCTGYPYDTHDLPDITPKKLENNSQLANSVFVVKKNRNEYIGEGSAAEALKIVKAHLPANIQPAIKGTADVKNQHK